MKSKFFIAGLTLSMLCGGAFAQDLTGTWQQIDDKSGSPKAIIEIRKESNKNLHWKNCKNYTAPRLYPKRNLRGLPLRHIPTNQF